jgi:hypothetical protein
MLSFEKVEPLHKGKHPCIYTDAADDPMLAMLILAKKLAVNKKGVIPLELIKFCNVSKFLNDSLLFCFYFCFYLI